MKKITLDYAEFYQNLNAYLQTKATTTNQPIEINNKLAHHLYNAGITRLTAICSGWITKIETSGGKTTISITTTNPAIQNLAENHLLLTAAESLLPTISNAEKFETQLPIATQTLLQSLMI